MATKKKTEKQLQHVIIRSRDSGVHAGWIVKREHTLAGLEVTLKDSRRCWYWDGAATLSELAKHGTKKPATCKFGVVLAEITVTGVCETIPTTDEARESIVKVSEWRA